ncbi:MAG: hypothetical protein H6755_05310 [Candidatus Omnitrophica bacterium]|nr:hypothetical protein [Candidatus Omnitrophota bacterium]MCB9747810.1 hypothetical protein [Candidatus Omnitrophota bacterium]
MIRVSIFLTFIILGLCLIALNRTRGIWVLNNARRKGLYPPKGKATMFDVRRLILSGEKELAIRIYCEIFEVSRKEAVKAVDELEKGIKEKKADPGR